jgi:UDP-N-acetylmuramate dehydrogenase
MSRRSAKTAWLGELTTLRVGGAPLRYYAPRTADELRDALRDCRRLGLPHRVLGGGSNVVVAEGLLPYAVIRVHTPGLDWIRRAGESRVRVGAGVPVSSLLVYCMREGLGGLEFLAGIPGVVGGALAGNVGAWGEDVFRHVRRLWLVGANGRQCVADACTIETGYRHAELGGRIVVECEIELEPRSRELVRERMASHLRARAARHPVGAPSAGCVFKNPRGVGAGQLLDLCGLKGLAIGGAEVSTKHANFVVNRGSATAADVMELIGAMRRQARDQFGVALELEVKCWPAEPVAA